MRRIAGGYGGEDHNAGGGPEPIPKYGSQRGASADDKEKKRFSFKQVDINYTFELIDKINV